MKNISKGYLNKMKTWSKTMYILFTQIQARRLYMFIGLVVWATCILNTSGYCTTGTENSYLLEVYFFSIKNDVHDFRFLFSGSVSTGTLKTQEDICKLSINTAQIQDRFRVTVDLVPLRDNVAYDSTYYEYDMSDIVPVSILLATDSNGRRYILNLVPKIKVIDRELKQACDETIRWEVWHVQNSPVIVNDEVYIGRMGATGESCLVLNVPYVAYMQCSLLPFKGAACLGILENGHLTISHGDGIKVEIFDVLNGKTPVKLEGGPYKVWVDWFPYSSVKDRDEKEMLQLLNTRYPYMGLGQIQMLLKVMRDGTMLSGVRTIHPQILLH